MFLITYSWNGRLAYATTSNVVDWLLKVNDLETEAYFILNVVEITDEEHKKIDGNLAGM